jgi:hypothetical protein
MTPGRRLRNRISHYLFVATILLSVILPVMFLHHHRLAVILAIWSLLWFGFLVHLSVGRRRAIGVLGGNARRRAIINAAITVVFLALFAVAAFHGDRGLEVAVSACLIYLAGLILYRFAKTPEQLAAMDWLLAAIFVGLVVYCAYLTALGHVAACSLPLTVAMLFWTILIRRHRILLPDLSALPQKMREVRAARVSLENDGPESGRTRAI